MKIIEKKCPNCGAGLSFGDNDKSCKCEYCHREFEIERDNEKTDDDAYNLIDPETAKTVAKVGIGIFAASSILPIIVFIIIFIGFIFIGGLIIKDINSDEDTPSKIKTEEVVKKTPVTNINELTNSDLKNYSNHSYGYFDVKGESSTKYTYQVQDNEVYKYILASKDNTNQLYVVERVLYINFFNKKDKKYVIIPVRYDNVMANLRIVDDEYEEIVDGSKVEAPRFNLNKEKSSYLRGGYANYKKFYTDKIEPLKKNGYTITQK